MLSVLYVYTIVTHTHTHTGLEEGDARSQGTAEPLSQLEVHALAQRLPRETN